MPSLIVQKAMLIPSLVFAYWMRGSTMAGVFYHHGKLLRRGRGA